MIWWISIFVWGTAIFFILVAPTIYHPEARAKFRRNLFGLLAWSFPGRAASTTAPNGNSTTGEQEQFHYVLSSSQEEEIRECFLVSKLKDFTKIVEGSDLDTANRSALPTTQTELSNVETGIVSTVNINGKTEKNATDPVMEVIKGTEDDDDDDDDDAPSEDFHVEEFGEEAGHILIPASGEQQSNKPNELRHVPNGCSVCLSPFAVGESITWSSNAECKHAFHHSCILDWFKASGRRQCRRRRRREQSEGMLNYANDPLLKITNFRMECPCCRQVFISTTTAQTGDVPTSSSEVASTVDSDENSSVSERSSTNLSSNEDTSSEIQPREEAVDMSNEDNV